MENKKFKPIPRHNDHGAGCKGHANWMLDSGLEAPEDRELLAKCVGNYMKPESAK